MAAEWHFFVLCGFPAAHLGSNEWEVKAPWADNPKRELWSCKSLVQMLEDTGQSAKTLLLTTLCVIRSPLTCTGKMDVFGLPTPDSAAIVSPSPSFFLSFVFLYFTFSFLPAAVLAPGCPRLLPPASVQGQALSCVEHNPFPREQLVPAPREPLPACWEGLGEQNYYFFPFPPSLMNCLLQPVGGAGSWTPPCHPPLVFCFACPCGWLSGIFPVCAFVPTGAPMPCPRIPGCSLGQAEQAEKKAQSPKCAIRQDHEAEGDSPSSLWCCAPTVKLRWEAIKMWNSPFPDRAVSQLGHIEERWSGSSSMKHRQWTRLCSNCINSFIACFQAQK